MGSFTDMYIHVCHLTMRGTVIQYAFFLPFPPSPAPLPPCVPPLIGPPTTPTHVRHCLTLITKPLSFLESRLNMIESSTLATRRRRLRCIDWFPCSWIIGSPLLPRRATHCIASYRELFSSVQSWGQSSTATQYFKEYTNSTRSLISTAPCGSHSSSLNDVVNFMFDPFRHFCHFLWSFVCVCTIITQFLLVAYYYEYIN